MPSMETAGLDVQAPTHCPHTETIAMLGNERVSHFASRAKYAVAFEDVALPDYPGQFAL